MKVKAWAVGMAVCVAAACGILASAQELLNASFEESSDDEDWFKDTAKHWGRWGNWINRETGWSPTHSGDCLIGYHHWRIQESDSSGIYQDVAGVPAGTECTFTVYAFKDPDTNAEYVEVRLEPYGGGAALASHTYPLGQLTAGKWELLTVSGKNTSEGLRVLIIVQPDKKGPRKGAVKFDDARLQLASAGAEE